MGRASNRAVFLDRDGVINVRRANDYVKRWDEFEFLPEIFSILPQIKQAGLLAIVITNQQGIAKGLMDEEGLIELHEEMQHELIVRSGWKFDAIYYCPHLQETGCDCRKPAPGMILQASEEFNIDLSRSWMIGDSPSDVEAGKSAGCRTGFVSTDSSVSLGDVQGKDLKEVWEKISSQVVE